MTFSRRFHTDRPRTLHFIIPNMLGYGGHIFNQTLEIGQAVEARGWHFQSHLPREVEDDQVVAQLHGVRDLTSAATKDFSDPNMDLGAANLRFFLDMENIGRSTFGPDDFIFLSALHHRNADGFIKWMSGFDETTMPKFTAHLWSHECFFNNSDEIHRRNSAIFGRALRWIASHPDHCRKLLAFSPGHLPLLHELAEVENLVKPYCASIPAVSPTALKQSNRDEIRFGYFGLSNWNQKGLRQWLDSMRELIKTPRHRFTLHLDLTGSDEDLDTLQNEFGDVLSNPAVRIFYGGMPREQYFQELASCDVIVLPYGPIYDTRESGIMHEAAACGVAVVLPSTSLPARRLRDAGIDMPSFSTWSPAAITAACRDAAARFVTLGQVMAARATLLNKEFTVENTLDAVGLNEMVQCGT